MKRIWIISLVIVTMLTGCNAQTNKKESIVVDSLSTPNTNIQVNKEYDKDGNLIRYDSSYVYYYSNIDSNPSLNDSIFNAFKNQFNIEYPFSNKDFFNDMFFDDTLLKYDFYKNDFFTERFRKNIERMDKLFLEMDSLKNNFYMQQLPKNKNKKKAKTI